MNGENIIVKKLENWNDIDIYSRIPLSINDIATINLLVERYGLEIMLSNQKGKHFRYFTNQHIHLGLHNISDRYYSIILSYDNDDGSTIKKFLKLDCSYFSLEETLEYIILYINNYIID